MPVALVAASFPPGDPGAAGSLAALRGALPGWDVLPADAGAGSRPPRLMPPGVRHADALVLTGPVLARAARARYAPAWLAIAAAIAARARPRAMVGISVPDLERRRTRGVARWLVGSTGLVVLRDAGSARRLVAAGVPAPFRVGADPAWIAAGPPPAAAAASAARIAVLLAGAGRLARRLEPALETIAHGGMTVRVVPWGGRDRRAAATFARRLRLAGEVEVTDPPADLRAARAVLTGSRAALAPGYHAALAAATAGVSFAAIGAEPGLPELARQLGQRSMSFNAGPAELAEALRAALGRPAAPAEAIEAQRASAHETLRLLRLLLSEGRSEDPSELEGLRLEPTP